MRRESPSEERGHRFLSRAAAPRSLSARSPARKSALPFGDRPAAWRDRGNSRRHRGSDAFVHRERQGDSRGRRELAREGGRRDGLSDEYRPRLRRVQSGLRTVLRGDPTDENDRRRRRAPGSDLDRAEDHRGEWNLNPIRLLTSGGSLGSADLGMKKLERAERSAKTL